MAKAELESWRMVNCFVKLNKKTVLLSQYPMMRVDDSYSLLLGMTRFSTLDFADGFYQIGIRPYHQGRTAFAVTGEGQWEYIRMAQGLAGSPATFNHAVNILLGPIRELWCEGELVSVLNPFVDDIIVAFRSVDWQIFHLSLVTDSVRAANMVLSAKKTSLFQSSVKYLGW